MKIGLIAVDTVNFPNLPLMKLSAWHKAQGNPVELFHDHSLKEADRIYMSKIFSFTPDYKFPVYASEVIKSGTGYYYPNGGVPLPFEAEHIMPDYSLYNITDTAYGFLTRGCPRGCGFCIVTKKEGRKSVKVSSLDEFWSGQKEIVLLDPNLLACREHGELLQSLIDSKAKIDFTQGLDIRLITKENIELLKKINVKMLHFAWDNYSDKDAIVPKFKYFKEQFPECNCSVYVLSNYDSTIEQDLERIYALDDMGYLPYVMIYDKEALSADHILFKIKQWTNNHAVFKACPDFEKYLGYNDAQKHKSLQKWDYIL
jgi:hypothetical protein